MLLGFYVKAQTVWGGLRERIAGERGAVATEYALLLVLIALAIVTAAGFLGKAIADRFTKACNDLAASSGC
jgi:Flp pilus assembly pilin Flp